MKTASYSSNLNSFGRYFITFGWYEMLLNKRTRFLVSCISELYILEVNIPKVSCSIIHHISNYYQQIYRNVGVTDRHIISFLFSWFLALSLVTMHVHNYSCSILITVISAILNMTNGSHPVTKDD
jgi:hypothetical protein